MGFKQKDLNDEKLIAHFNKWQKEIKEGFISVALFLQAFSHLKKNALYKNTVDTLEENLKTELGVDETAEMVGFTDNPYPYFKAADFYVLSSRYEGFPTVLFEAIILRKNIIATEVSGVNEMLENGKLGLIVENSEEGIYKGMKKALTEPEFFEPYQENLKDYKMPFNLENSVNKIMKIIDE